MIWLRYVQIALFCAFLIAYGYVMFYVIYNYLKSKSKKR